MERRQVREHIYLFALAVIAMTPGSLSLIVEVSIASLKRVFIQADHRIRWSAQRSFRKSSALLEAVRHALTAIRSRRRPHGGTHSSVRRRLLLKRVRAAEPCHIQPSCIPSPSLVMMSTKFGVQVTRGEWSLNLYAHGHQRSTEPVSGRQNGSVKSHICCKFGSVIVAD
jgi:hypothetical protein